MASLRTTSTLLALLLVGVVGGGGVARGAVIGVNEDETKTRTALYGQIAEVGLRQNVLSVTWTQGQGLSGAVRGVIRGAIQAASAQGVAIVLAVYPAPGNAAKFGDPANKAEFVTFVGNVVRSFPEVRAVIVGNEPNRTLFMSPVNPAIKVLGVGLSPRGAGDGKSQFPPQFVKAMGDWYRASERAKQGKPLMGTFSFHPYPFPEDKSPTVASDWPVVGIPDLYRLKQAIWDAFQGTPQKTVEDGLLLDLDEVAYQVPTDGKGGYTGSETVKTVSEATQADTYAQIVKLVACDPQIGSLSFFHLIDEADRARFQSGFLDVSSRRRPVADAVKQALAETAGGSKCTGTPDLSKLKTSYPKTVSSLTVGLLVEEDAAVQVALFKLAGGAVTDVDKAAIERTLAARGAGVVDPVQVATLSRAIPAAPMAKPDHAATLELKLAKARDDGVYVFALVTKSALNPARLTRATNDAFTVGTPAVTPPSSGGGSKPPAEADLIEYSDFYDPASIGSGTAMYLTLRVTRPVDYSVKIRPVICKGAPYSGTYYTLKGGSLAASKTTKIVFTLPATFRPGLWRITAKARDKNGVTQSVQSKGYVAGGVPGPDKVAPDLTVIDAVEAVPAAGDGIPLRYEACENSGETADEVTVRAGTRTGAVVAKLTTPQAVTASFRRYLVSWKPKVVVKDKTFAVCIVATDRAGNRSPELCGKLVVGKERPATQPLWPPAIPTISEVIWPEREAYRVTDRPLLRLRFAAGWKVESLGLYRISCAPGSPFQQLIVNAPPGSSASADVALSFSLGGQARFSAPTVEPGIYQWRLMVVQQTGAKSVQKWSWYSPAYLVTSANGTTGALTSVLDSGAMNVAASLPATGGDVPLTFNGCSGTGQGTLDITVYEADGKTEVDRFITPLQVMLPMRMYEVWRDTPEVPAGTTGARLAFIYCAVLSDRGYKSPRSCGGIYVNVLRR